MTQSQMINWNTHVKTELFTRIGQNLEVLNAASLGAITLTAGKFEGDKLETSFFNTLRSARRDINQYGPNGAVTPVEISQRSHKQVKFKDGYGPINSEPGQFSWLDYPTAMSIDQPIQQFADIYTEALLNKAIGSLVAAIGNEPLATLDVSTSAPVNQRGLNKSHAKFGDHSPRLLVQVMHSSVYHDLLDQAAANSTSLFDYASLRVVDVWGKKTIVTDDPSLINDTDDKAYVLSLTEDAVRLHMQDDLNTVINPITGNVRLITQFQSEWTTGLSLRGYSWDGGNSPISSELFTGANWDMTEESIKFTAGTMLIGQAPA